MYNALLPLKAVNWSNVWKLLNLTKKLELLLRRLMSEPGTRYCFSPRSWVLGEKLEPISLQLSGTLQGMTSPQRGPTSNSSLSQQALISIWWLFKVKFYASTNTLTVTCNDVCMYIFIPICSSEMCESTNQFMHSLLKKQTRNPRNL